MPLLGLPPAQRLAHAPAAAAELGRFLAALHAVPAREMAWLAGPDEVPTAEWRHEAAASFATVTGVIPPVQR